MRDRRVEHLLERPDVRAQLQVLILLVQIATGCAVAAGAVVLIVLTFM